MIITGMNHFQNVAKKKLVEWYRKNRPMSGQSNGTDKRKLVLLSTWSQDWTADRKTFQY